MNYNLICAQCISRNVLKIHIINDFQHLNVHDFQSPNDLLKSNKSYKLNKLFHLK